MNKKRIVTLICLLLFCSSFGERAPPDPKQIVHAIAVKSAKGIEPKERLLFTGSSSGKKISNIEQLAIQFLCKQESTLEEARELILRASERYLSEINGSKEIRSYLHHFPFTPDDLEVVIYFRTPEKGEERLTVASLYKGKISYCRPHPSEITLVAIHEESYKEALHLALH
jgi:hypothetical protein